MNRKEFIEKTSKLGVCCGALFAVDGKVASTAESDETDTEALRVIGTWVATLLDALDENLNKESKEAILETCGRECARRGFKKVALKYKGDLKGLISEINRQLADSIEFDDFDGIVRIYGKKNSSCNCPIVRSAASLSGSICMCSQGWHKEIFETVTGRPVWIEPEKTVVRGDDRCIHAIYLS